MLEVGTPIILSCKYSLRFEANTGYRHPGNRTRPLSQILAEKNEQLADGYKNLTTPQLHYLTRCLNAKGTPHKYGIPTERGYYEKLAAAFETAINEGKRSGSVPKDIRGSCEKV